MAPSISLLFKVWTLRLLIRSSGFFQSLIGAPPEYTKFRPDRSFTVKSTRSKRQIRVNVYEPKGFDKSKTYPVHLNFHGSGFVLPAFFGTDADFCRLVSDRTGAIVLDGDYAKAPENPFPAATDDTKDILDHITANAEGYYDTSRITIGGFSAGGTLALTAGVSQPQGTIKGIVAIYPCVDVGLEMAIRNPPSVSPGNKNPISPAFNRLVIECYTPPGTDLSDPRLSPINTPISTLPNDILMVVCEEDPLRFDAVQLAQKLKDAGLNVVFKELKKMVHAWDKRAQVGTPQGDARKETYEAAVDLLNSVYAK